MRAPPALPSIVGFLLLAAPVTAQGAEGEPGCVQANPCEVIVELDASGFADLAPDTFGTGDWILFSIYNADDETHTVRLEGHTFEVSVAAGDIADTQPLKLGAPGSYDLSDAPTGDTAILTVEALEAFGDEGTSGSTSEGGNGIPGLAPSLVLVGLAASAWVARRR